MASTIQALTFKTWSILKKIAGVKTSIGRNLLVFYAHDEPNSGEIVSPSAHGTVLTIEKKMGTSFFLEKPLDRNEPTRIRDSPRPKERIHGDSGSKEPGPPTVYHFREAISGAPRRFATTAALS